MNFCIGYHDNLSTMICQFIFCFFLNSIIFIHLPVSSDTTYTAVIHIAHFNTTTWCTCMHNLSVTNINTYMTIITNHITRQHLRLTHCAPASCKGVGITGCGNTTCRMDQVNKSGTVRSIGQAVSSIYIRVTDITESCRCDGGTTAPS